MAETAHPEEPTVEETQSPLDAPAGEGKRALATAAGVTAAVVGGAALAVGVERQLEERAWSRLQEKVLTRNGTIAEAGGTERPHPEITVPQMLRRTIDRFASRPALQRKVKDEWETTTYTELGERVLNLAVGLDELGIRKGDRVAILSENCLEWALTDLAVLSLGAATVPLYATLPPPQVQHIVADSGAVALIVEDQKQLAKAQEIRAALPDLKHLILIEPVDPMPPDVATFAAVEAIGQGQADRGTRFERLWHQVQPGDLASIIYTSGTTGLPKGAMLTHDNFMSNAQAIPTLVDIYPDDVFLAFLPLAHIFSRLAGHYLPLICGSTIAYSRGLRHLPREMQEVHPTVMCAVPRLLEGMQAKIQEEAAKRAPKERKIFDWAIKVGERHNGSLSLGKEPGLITRLEYRAADKLVLSKLRQKVVGGRLRYFISGGAPLAMDTALFFNAVGWSILQGYGLTETSPVICVNKPHMNKFGTVGPPIPGVQVRIAEDGEILCKGPNVMQGYFNLPDATAQAIDPEGWFHTGDIGELDSEGYLRITDRKKDLLVLANGKNVAPQPIENRLKASQYVTHVALFGDKQPVVVALLVPNFERLKLWAQEKAIPTESIGDLLQHAEVRKLFKNEIDANQKELADFEKVRRFTLLDHDWTIDGGELTPTLKVKRRVLAERHADAINRLYAGASGGD